MFLHIRVSAPVEEFQVSWMLHHIMDDIIDFVGGYTVYVTFGNERCVYYITERHLWIHRLGIDIDAVAAYHIDPHI